MFENLLIHILECIGPADNYYTNFISFNNSHYLNTLNIINYEENFECHKNSSLSLSTTRDREEGRLNLEAHSLDLANVIRSCEVQ